MTQLEILELAYDAAAERWAEAKEKADKAIAEGRPCKIAMNREAKFAEKLEELQELIDIERQK